MIGGVIDGADPDMTPGRRAMSAGSASLSCLLPYSLDEVVQEDRGSPYGPVEARFLDQFYDGVRCSSVAGHPFPTTDLSASSSSEMISMCGSPVKTGFGVLLGWVCLFPYRYSFPFRGGVPSVGLLVVSDYVPWLPLCRL